MITCSVVPGTKGSSPHTRGALRDRARRVERPRDHPRIRGEHLYREGAQVRLPGIIPAYAGSTCGTSPIGRRRTGSSPHTRGARLSTRHCRLVSRDHPRIRGEHLHMASLYTRAHGDHPRIRGEHVQRLALRARNRGSSPHTRGAQHQYFVCIVALWDHPRIRGEHSLWRVLLRRV